MKVPGPRRRGQLTARRTTAFSQSYLRPRFKVRAPAPFHRNVLKGSGGDGTLRIGPPRYMVTGHGGVDPGIEQQKKSGVCEMWAVIRLMFAGNAESGGHDKRIRPEQSDPGRCPARTFSELPA